MGDYRTTAGEPPPVTPRQRRAKRFRFLLFSFFLLLVLTAVSLSVKVPRRVRASGYVTTEEYAEVRVPTQGIVAEILVSSGEDVTQDQVLMRMDNRMQQSLLDEARSRLRQTQAELARREIEIREKLREHHDELRLLTLREKHLSGKLRRAEELEARGLASQAEVEDQRLLLELLREELNARKNRDLSIFEQELEVLRYQVKAREENVESMALQMSLFELRAPIGGKAVRYEFVNGELVRPENILYEIFGGQKKVLKVRVPERHASRVAEGHAYRARLASYAGLQRIWFRGQVIARRQTIQGEGPGTYRTVYCTFDGAGFDVPPGTSAEVWIETGLVPLWAFVLGID